MTESFAILTPPANKNQLPKLDIYKNKASSCHSRIPIWPELFVNQAEKCQDLPLDALSEIKHRTLRTENLVSGFNTENIRLGKNVLYEITTDRDGSQYLSAFPDLEIGKNHFYTFITTKYANDISFKNIKAVRIRTGSCLFSNLAARFVEDDGELGPALVIPVENLPDKPYRDIKIDDALTLYEFETTLRLGAMIGEVINSLDANTNVKVVLDVPRVQYYLYLMDLFKLGLVGPELIFKWFAAVDNRSTRVKQLLKRRTQNRLISRRIEFADATDLRGLEAYLRQEIAKNNREITIDDCIDAFLQNNDPILELLIKCRKIKNFRDLSHLSYIADMLMVGLGEKDEIGLDIENHIERRVFSYVAKFAPKVCKLLPGKSFALIGLYPRERIFTTDKTWRPSLYRFDPGRYALDAKGNEIDMFELAKQFYN